MADVEPNSLAKWLNALADGILPYLFLPTVCTIIWFFSGRGIFWPVIVWILYAVLYRRRERSRGH